MTSMSSIIKIKSKMAVGTLNENNLPDQIAQVCFNHYSQLGKRGKPLFSTEWTLMAAIVQSVNNNLSVVAMATGTKCIGHTAMSAKGDIVNDSHAEVLARRCFLRYLYDQVETTKEKGSSVIFSTCNENEKCVLRPNVDFILFTSHVPCGDASIIPKMLNEKKRKCTFSECGEPEKKAINIQNKKVVVSENCCVDLIKNSTASSIPITTTKELIGNDTDSVLSDNIGDVVDIYRTGAKCVGDKQDAKLPGVGYHVLGAVRTKPGRGDPTLSVSCSDKISRWIAVGLQGACLSFLIEDPILLKHIVVAAGGPYSHVALHRALISRIQPTHVPELAQSSLIFVHSRYKAMSAKPSPTSIMWTKLLNNALEIGVEGRKQGITKKTLDKGRLMICKFELFKKFISLTGDKYKGMSYREVKDNAKEYQDNWRQCREKLRTWAEKPRHLTEFRIEA